MTDAEKIAAITRYRDAYFAYYATDMQRNLEYERLRAVHPWSDVTANDDFFNAWNAYATAARWEELNRLRYELHEALFALTASPPADYAALQACCAEELPE